jgi:hypothetical protein
MRSTREPQQGPQEGDTLRYSNPEKRVQSKNLYFAGLLSGCAKYRYHDENCIKKKPLSPLYLGPLISRTGPPHDRRARDPEAFEVSCRQPLR